MAKGSSQKRSTYDRWVEQLNAERCRFRLRILPTSPFLQIREVVGGKTIRQFSSGIYRVNRDDDVEACGEHCRQANKLGVWTAHAGTAIQGVENWKDLAIAVTTDLRARIAREGSRKNAEGHLKQIANLGGKLHVESLKKWVLERNPITQPSAFRNRVETLSHINRATYKGKQIMDLDPLITEMKALKPTGAAKKEIERRTEKIKAIPSDEALEAWLDDLDGVTQWVLALISTYGLRPSEAWHATGIDVDGWIEIPGDGLTKTARHIAPPVPGHWVDRYKLRENFKRHTTELNKRWTIRWEDRDGVQIPVNNSQVSDSLRKRFGVGFPKLMVGKEWVRPYDLRHSYAIRCFTNPEVFGQSEEDFARWLGHGVDVHKRVYLRFMTKTREDEALKAKFVAKRKDEPEQEKSPTVVELPSDVLEKLAKLEKLEKLLNS